MPIDLYNYIPSKEEAKLFLWWAFGKDWNPSDGDEVERWNKLHGDAFFIREEYSIHESLIRMVALWNVERDGL